MAILLILRLVVLGVLGVLVGAVVAAVAAVYSADRRFWPGPRRRLGNCAASPLASQARACSLFPPRDVRGGQVSTPSLFWVGVVMSATFCGLGLRYGAEPALLLVSLVEATLLLLLLAIDVELRLVPTPVVGLLAAVALASATLWPTLSLRDALLGGAVGCGSFAALVGLARLLYGTDALGLGDAWLALAIGCITGYPLVVGTLALGIVLGGLGALAVLLVRRGALREAMPYGPFLITSVLYVLAHGHTLLP